MMLGVDLVRMSWDKQIQRAVIVTADSDFVYAVQAAKDAGVITQLWYSSELLVNQSLLDVFGADPARRPISDAHFSGGRPEGHDRQEVTMEYGR